MANPAPPGTAERPPGRWRPALAGLGVFLLVIGLMLRFYAAPRLVAAPTNLYLTLTLTAPGSAYFNEGALTSEHNATLSYSLTIRGDPKDSTGKLAVWDSYAALSDPKTGAQVNSTFQRLVFNRRTSELLTCCGASVNDDTRIRQHGIGILWPIGTRKTTYEVFDVNAQSAWPATYSGTARVQGITAYRFTQHIPPTLVAQMPGVPLSLLGVHGKTGNVVANRYYQADNTFWIDPRTGVLIDTEQRILSVLHGPGGEGTLLGVRADLKMTPASQRSLASLASKNAAQIKIVRQTGPLGGVVLGLILILAATIPFPGRRRAALRRRRARAREALAAGDLDDDMAGHMAGDDPGAEGPTEEFGSPGR